MILKNFLTWRDNQDKNTMTAAPTYIIEVLEKVFTIPEEFRRFWKVTEEKEKVNFYSCSYDSTPVVLKELLNIKGFDKEKETILSMRGVIVHIPRVGDIDSVSPDSVKIVTRGFKYTPSVTVLAGMFESSKLELTDNFGHTHVVDINDPNTSFSQYFDGAGLRISKVTVPSSSSKEGGTEFVVSTSSRMDTTRSKWGNSGFFPDIYKEMGGPEYSELFPEDEPNPTFSQVFILVHPVLQTGTNFPIGKGFLVYLGAVSNETGDFLTSTPNTVYGSWIGDRNITALMEAKSGVLSDLSEYPLKDVEGSIVFPGQVSTRASNEDELENRSQTILDALNKTLTVGYSGISEEGFARIKDPRLLPGEAVMCRYTEGGVRKMLRITPVSANWRVAVINNNPNKYHEFVSKYSYALPSKSEEIVPTVPDSEALDLITIFNGMSDNVYSHSQLFPLIATPTALELDDFISRVASGELTVRDYSTVLRLNCEINPKVVEPKTLKEAMDPNPLTRDLRDQKFSNIAMCFILATAPGTGSESFYTRFLTERQVVIDELCSKYLTFKMIEGIPSRKGYVDYENDAAAGRQVPPESKLSDLLAYFKGSSLNPGGKALLRIFNTSAFGASKAANVRKRLEYACTNLIGLMLKEYGPSLFSIINSTLKFIANKGSTRAHRNQEFLQLGYPTVRIPGPAPLPPAPKTYVQPLNTPFMRQSLPPPPPPPSRSPRHSQSPEQPRLTVWSREPPLLGYQHSYPAPPPPMVRDIRWATAAAGGPQYNPVRDIRDVRQR
jgi:hypothetical protein